MSGSDQPFDPGMQPERTAMAWRRTVLAVAVGALVSVRLLPPVLGLWALVVGGAGFLAAAAIWVLATRRGRVIQDELRRETYALPDGSLPLVLTTLVSLGALVGIGYVLTA